MNNVNKPTYNLNKKEVTSGLSIALQRRGTLLRAEVSLLTGCEPVRPETCRARWTAQETLVSRQSGAVPPPITHPHQGLEKLVNVSEFPELDDETPMHGLVRGSLEHRYDGDDRGHDDLSRLPKPPRLKLPCTMMVDRETAR